MRGRLNRFEVAHFADENDVGSRGCGRSEFAKGMRCPRELALVHQALLVIVKKFDGVLGW